MRLEPLGDKVVVKPLEADARTSGGILLPGTARERPQQGRVLSVGSGRWLPSGACAPPQVREGDRVVFGQWAGSQVVVDGQEVLVMREDEILAVLE